MLCSKLNQLFPEKKFRFLRHHWAILKLLMFERMMLWNHYFHENQHIKNLQVRGLKSSFARNFNLCFRFAEFGVEKLKSTGRKCLHLLDIVLNLETLGNEKWSVWAFAVVIASVSAIVSAHKWGNLPCASFQIERVELIPTMVYHQSVFCSLWM